MIGKPLHEQSILTLNRTSKDKLNAFHLGGSIGIAAIVGLIAESWVMFVVMAAALIAASVATGEIRLPNRRRKS